MQADLNKANPTYNDILDCVGETRLEVCYSSITDGVISLSLTVSKRLLGFLDQIHHFVADRRSHLDETVDACLDSLFRSPTLVS